VNTSYRTCDVGRTTAVLSYVRRAFMNSYPDVLVLYLTGQGVRNCSVFFGPHILLLLNTDIASGGWPLACRFIAIFSSFLLPSTFWEPLWLRLGPGNLLGLFVHLLVNEMLQSVSALLISMMSIYCQYCHSLSVAIHIVRYFWEKKFDKISPVLFAWNLSSSVLIPLVVQKQTWQKN